MADLNDIDDATLRDLVRLVDGTLPPERLEEVEARVSAEPALQEIVEQQLRGRALAQGIDAEAPAQVHAKIAARSRGGRPRPSLAIAIGGAGAVLAVVAAVLVVAVAPNTQSVDTQRVAEVAVRAAEEAPPPVDTTTAALLDGEFAGLQFPNWQPEFQLTPSGSRVDTVEGRTVKTVYYDNAAGDRRVGYTIVSGGALDVPGGATPRSSNGVELDLFEGPNGPTVTWERDGHTCVLSGDATPEMLIAMASWKGGGAVQF